MNTHDDDDDDDGCVPLQATTQQMSSSTPALLLAPNVQSHKIIQPGLIRVTNAPNGGLLLSISQVTNPLVSDVDMFNIHQISECDPVSCSRSPRLQTSSQRV